MMCCYPPCFCYEKEKEQINILSKSLDELIQNNKIKFFILKDGIGKSASIQHLILDNDSVMVVIEN